MTDKEKELIEKFALTYGYSYEEINYHFQKMKQVCIDVMEVMQEIANTVIDWINDRRTRNVRDFNWNVPMDTTRLSQVRIPNILLPRIRNLI